MEFRRVLDQSQLVYGGRKCTTCHQEPLTSRAYEYNEKSMDALYISSDEKFLYIWYSAFRHIIQCFPRPSHFLAT